MTSPAAGSATVDPDLARLAAGHGVATSYEDQRRRRVDVTREAVVQVLAALGVAADTPEAVRASLRALQRRPAAPPVVVLRTSESRSVPAPVGYSVRLRLEDGTERDLPAGDGRVTLPAGLPLGWHTMQTDVAELPVVVTPERVSRRGGRGWGWMVQLYALRSSGSWGVGDLRDLRTLTEWTAAHGGDLVLVNPLHAVAPTVPMQPSPYFPGSRRWTNPLYLRVEDTVGSGRASAEVRAQVDALRPAYDAERVDRDACWAAKLAALELLWQQDTGRDGQSWPDDSDDVWTFATWCALGEQYGADWRTWPQALHRPDAPAVTLARTELADRVRFHVWLQLLCDAQLDRSQQSARAAGLGVGVVHDLAVGADPGGADAWMLQDTLALGARIGAPPDLFNQQGQDWGMPPWHPRRLAEHGYVPLRELLRPLLRHSGGLRIDHVLGMFRMWWIPAGADARGGTYVSYDADALLGVIALEAERAGAIVVGEDLGVVPDGVREELADRDMLGTSVLWFEREETEPGETGALTPLPDWREAAMASVTTHDLPTALGWLRGEHVRVRAELGLLDDAAAEEQGWRRDRAELLAHLVAAGVLASVDAPEDELVRALHRAVAATPSRFVLAAPSDAVGDLRQPNLPGTVDEYPNWRLPVADTGGRPMLLDELLADPRVERLAAELREQVR
ncbi:MAG TPA: 4-alpha-glucanotransferase [Mycobacteriales bacterium]|nr:4-alpha-glucanotransferase [Mycobacteriales bacterium]